jgi:biopolymer transport protein ExbB
MKMIDVLVSGGPVMVPLLLLSLLALAIIIERMWALRRRNFLDEKTVSTLSQLLVQRDFERADEFCRRHPGPFTQLVSTLIQYRDAPYEEIKEALEDTGRRELKGLERGLPALSTVVAGAPLLGLLGTVLGMIKIFAVVATTGTGVAEKLSEGIAEALITTATGLIIAIPVLFVYAYLEGRAENILSDIEEQIADFTHLVRKPVRHSDGRP